MKRKYTKKQICEAIAYWKKQLKNGNYKKVNESIDDYYIENPNVKDIARKNPYAIEFSYRQAYNDYGYGVIAASSKEALMQIVNSMYDKNSGFIGSYVSQGPLVTNVEPMELTDVYEQLDKCPKKQDFIDAKAIVDNVLKGKYVSYSIETDDQDTFIVFEPHDWKHQIMSGEEGDDYYVEVH